MWRETTEVPGPLRAAPTALPGSFGGASSAVDIEGSAAPAGMARAVVVVLVRHRTRALPFALTQLATGPWRHDTAPGLRMARVMGSGRRGGFGLVPSLHTQGWIGLFDTVAGAQGFARGCDGSSGSGASSDPSSAQIAAPHRVVASRRAHALRDEQGRPECLVTVLEAVSSRGRWQGHGLEPSTSLRAGEPIAVITRAAIRPSKAREFWRHSPATERSLAAQPGCRLAIGLGEAPLLRQLTFSVWDNLEAMQAYAHGGAHGAATRGAWQHDWFGEWLFARFAIAHMAGVWQGSSAQTLTGHHRGQPV
jgi:hypothetical protein